MIACNQTVKFQIKKKKKAKDLLHFKFNLLGLAVIFCVHGVGRTSEGWTQSIHRSFFHHEHSGSCDDQQ